MSIIKLEDLDETVSEEHRLEAIRNAMPEDILETLRHWESMDDRWNTILFRESRYDAEAETMRDRYNTMYAEVRARFDSKYRIAMWWFFHLLWFSNLIWWVW